MESKEQIEKPDDVGFDILIREDGAMEMFAVNLLEDLWHDYQYYIGQAEESAKEGNSAIFLTKRHLRTSLIVLMAYLEGVLNRWCKIIKKSQGITDEDISKFIRFTCFQKKYQFISKEARKASNSIKSRYPKMLKRMRDEIVHLKPGNNMDIWEIVTVSGIRNVEEDISSWMTSVETALGVPRYPDTDKAMEAFSNLGTTTDEVSSSDR